MLASTYECVQGIEARLRELHRSVIDKLLPGVSQDSISLLLKSCGLDAPDGLVALYAIHDGTGVEEGEPLDDIHFFPGFYWLSLADAVEIYRSISPDVLWDDSWFPVFSNGGGDFYAVICDENSPNFGSVVGFLLGSEVQSIEFQSVLTMLRTSAECYERGVYFLDGEYLESRDAEAAQVAKLMNPDITY
jgi:cell wall assembly regulator SMI1